MEDQEHAEPTAPDLSTVCAATQAAGFAGMQMMFTLHQDLQRGVFLKKVDEVDLVQAAAAKELGKMGAHTDPRLPVAPV